MGVQGRAGSTTRGQIRQCVTAIPKLLDLVTLHGVVVTIDAIGCQTSIAKQVRDRGGHYLVAVKDNRPSFTSIRWLPVI